MGAMDKMKNEAEDLKGKAKEAVGDATDNRDHEAEGHADQAKAGMKKVGEDVKDVFKS